ncbi:MAG: hypothetical protein KAR45_18965, partial [Desulfobacteraceae bacterium]|nr:hypothetical protein [Desulfobacteraceae bacterium]
MIKRFGFMSGYRFLFAVVIALILLTSSYAAGEQAQFKHKLLTLTLPDGWSVNKDVVPADILIGMLKSESIPGSSILIYSYRGMKINFRNVRNRGLLNLDAEYPKGQKHLKKPKTIKTDSGYKARVELWLGLIDVGKITVALHSPMAVMKTKKSYILMIGYTPEATSARMEKDFLKILKSA